MLITDELLNELNTLRKLKQDELLQARLLSLHEDFKRQNRAGELAYVVSELAHFYTVSTLRDMERANTYHLELEQLEPGAQSKWMTAGFYHAFGSPGQVIEKVNQIDPLDPDSICRYSALSLKGQACIAINKLEDAEKTLDELLALARRDDIELPYGDEYPFLEAAVKVPLLSSKCRELLELLPTRIQDKGARKLAQQLLESSDGGTAPATP